MSKDHPGYRLQPAPCLSYCELGLIRMQPSIVFLGNYLSVLPCVYGFSQILRKLLSHWGRNVWQPCIKADHPLKLICVSIWILSLMWRGQIVFYQESFFFFQNPKQITQTNQPNILQPESKTRRGIQLLHIIQHILLAVRLQHLLTHVRYTWANPLLMNSNGYFFHAIVSKVVTHTSQSWIILV